MPKHQRLFIINDPTMLRVIPSLAEEIGLNESIVLLQIEYWISISNNEMEGRKWTYQSVRDMHEKAFPFWGKSTIHRTIRNLVDMGYLVEDNFNKKKYDKTGWYALGDKISNLKSVSLIKIEVDLSQNRTTPSQNGTRSNQNGTTIPENTTKNTNIDQDTGENHACSFKEEQSTSKSIKELPKHLSVPSKFTAAKKDDPIDQVVERVMHREKKVILKKPKFNTNTMIAYFSESFKEFFDGATPPIELQKDRGLMKKLIDHYEYDFVKEMIDWAFNNYAQFRREKKIDGVLTIGIIFGFRAYLQDKIQHRFVDTESEW